MITFSKIISVVFLVVGFFLLIQVILPIISFKIWEGQNIQSNSLLVSPVSVQVKDNFPTIISSFKRESKLVYDYFYISIPDLKIIDAKVLVDSNDLSFGPVHLPGSALPGEKGNVFISGHSGFRQAIFKNLADLKKGDLIQVKASGLEFSYQVIGLKVVDPNDLSVVAPLDAQNRYLTLMTCVPPGLNIKRLIVLTKLV